MKKTNENKKILTVKIYTEAFFCDNQIQIPENLTLEKAFAYGKKKGM